MGNLVGWALPTIYVLDDFNILNNLIAISMAIDHNINKNHDRSSIYSYPLSNFKTAIKAACGTSTVPKDFIRFLPLACFCNSFFFREISPP
jgi:hypothetical protein